MEALRRWLAEPAAFPRIYHEAAIKVMSGDLVPPAVTVGSLQRLKAELDEIGARIDAAEERAATITHRAVYLRLNHRLAHRIVEAHAAWIEEIEAELGDLDTPPAVG